MHLDMAKRQLCLIHISPLYVMIMLTGLLRLIWKEKVLSRKPLPPAYNGRRAFSVAGPMFWNSLPRTLRDPSHTAGVFGRSLETFIFLEY